MVPAPRFESYYGKQIIKTPTWKTPDVPLYLFLGGLSGSSAVLAEGAALTGNVTLERAARAVAAGGAGIGTVFLIHDLGRPERFLNMLRVLKPTSPLSVGSFILAPFASLASAALASQVTGRLPRPGPARGRGGGGLRATAGDLHRGAVRQHRRAGVARGAPGAPVRLRRLRRRSGRWDGHAAGPGGREPSGAADGAGRRGPGARGGRGDEAPAGDARRAVRPGPVRLTDADRLPADDRGRSPSRRSAGAPGSSRRCAG